MANHWHADAISHTERLTEVALHQLGDINEASWLVHRVMLNAMTDMHAPATRRGLDSALGHLLREYPANAA